ncbi:hypothetical protein G9A89_011431 [Geosiphon pyriformis]|nr:hypothetical protein G9A89_011431 [Geosiphon pyriformis]
MNRFARVELTSGLRPILGPTETILAIQDNIGLYEGNEKLAEYANGKVYLTTHRVIYVDSEQPQTKSLALNLQLVKGREFFTGFLKSSPKIILRFTENIYGLKSQAPTLASPSSSTTTLITPAIWICPICSYSNNSTTLNLKCQLCGVKRVDGPATAPISLSDVNNVVGDGDDDDDNDGSGSLSKSQRSPYTKEPTVISSKTLATSSDGISCPVCTFFNHPSMMRCEVCESELGTFKINGLKISEDAIILSPAPGKSVTSAVDYVKLAFRGGGSGLFYDKLKIAMTEKKWEKMTEQAPSKSSPDFNPGLGGIRGIEHNVTESKKEQEETLAQAFKDLDGLMAKAEEMERVSSPVTKRDAGSSYHQELSRQLAEFLEKILERENGMMALTDIYCLFNRARGVALISPEDLYKACSLFEKLNLPMRLRKFESGLNITSVLTHSDEQTAQLILSFIRAEGPKTAIDVAERQNASIFLVTEQLLMTEAKGLICRDETVEGIRFYDNLINNYHWESED